MSEACQMSVDSKETLRECRQWILDEISELNKLSLYHRQSAEISRAPMSEADRKAAHQMAEQMSGRRLPKSTRANDLQNAVIDDRIADKYEKKIWRLQRYADGLAEILGEK